ncbi:MAG: glycosyltransferase family 4 protein [Gemmatimonadaceae bacterium]
MRIGVDATCWANPRGYGRFARELLSAIVSEAPQHEFVCFADRRALESCALSGANVRRVEVPLSASPTIAAAANGHRTAADLLRLTRAVYRERPDLFFSPSVYTYFPLPPGQRAVVTLHDAIAERFPELTLPSLRARLFWRLKVGLALRQARLVLTVSEYAARDIAAVLGVARERIRVAVEAPAAAYRPSEPGSIAAAAQRAGLPPGSAWFTYVGGFNPHKRVGALVTTLAQLVPTLGDATPFLLLVGPTADDVFHADLAELRGAIERHGLERRVRWLGYVPDEELRHLHSGALATLLPSLCEGFGLAAVEAAACGTPVIATTESPLPELLEGGGIFVRPGDDDTLRTAMLLVARDAERRRALGARALERASRLSWSAAARSALGAMEEAAAA